MSETYDAIDLLADKDPIALRDLAWKLLGERDDYAARLKATDRSTNERLCVVEAERDAMRPVVEAAKVWREQFARPPAYPRAAALMAAVDALAEPEAPDA